MTKTLKNIFSFVVVLIILLFLLRSLILNWNAIPFDKLHFNVLFIAISFLFLFLHFLSYSRSWQQIMNALDQGAISFIQSSWIIAVTQIAKYLPGRVWYMIGRVYIGKKENMKGASLAVSMVLETCLLFISSSILFLISVVVSGKYEFKFILLCVILLLSAFIIIEPHILNTIINFILKIFKKPMVHINISYLKILLLSIYFFGLWSAQIIGFYFLLNSIYTIPISYIFELAGAYTLSWIAGFIVIFAPSGLGVREGVMTLLLASIIPSPLAIAVSFIARVWITVFELIVFFIGLLIKKKNT